jgi:hypothetical protein
MIRCWCDLAFIPTTGIDGREGYCFRRRGPGGVAWPGFAMLLGFSVSYFRSIKIYGYYF